MGLRGPKLPPHDSSVVHEPSWEERQRGGRRQRRRQRLRSVRRLLGPGLVVVLLAAIGVVGAGLTGRGPYAHLAAEGEPSASLPPATTALAGTTSSTYGLQGRRYRPGDCVIWDQRRDQGGTRPTDVIPCDRPHLIEITGQLKADDPGHYPTEAQWDEQIERRCKPLAEQHLGAPVDPGGRYAVSAIRPIDRSWRNGDRELWCGLQANWRDDPTAPEDRSTPFVGAVRDRSQFWTYEPGQCLEPGGYRDVPCREPHWTEVTGSTVLPDGTALPAPDDNDGWDRLVGETCSAKADRYLGHRPPEPWRSGWITIEPGSWAAGNRTVTCVLGQTDGDRWATVTVPARSTTA